MAETLSPHYSWVKPDIGGDASTWGNVLNQTIDAVDSVVWANQQAGLPIGSVAMFAGATAPPNWLICNGSSLSTTGTYAALFAVLGYTYGGSGANFNLPNLVQNFPLGAGTNPLGTVGGASTVTLATTNLPPHAHPITDVVHNHSVNQWAHAHAIATGGHSHAIHTSAHSHTIPDNLVSGSGSGLTSGGASFSLHGGAVTSTVGDLGGNTDTTGNLGGNTDTQTSSVSLNNSGTGLSTTQSVGSGASFNVVPPFVAINFIVRYQ